MHHILLIDDNSFFTATFAGLLRRKGFRVDVASDPAEGRRLHRTDPADLVLMGIYLRKQDAGQYLEDLRGAFAGTPLIGLFCEKDRNDRQYPLLLKELGHRRCYHKPFRTEDLLEAIYAEIAVASRRAG